MCKDTNDQMKNAGFYLPAFFDVPAVGRVNMQRLFPGGLLRCNLEEFIGDIFTQNYPQGR